MEQTEEMSIDENSSKRNCEERFAWEEWTVISESKDKKILTAAQRDKQEDGSSSDTSYSEIDNTSDAEEAREPIRVLSEENIGTRSLGHLHCRSEESDGVSVITESESDAPLVNENEKKIIVYRSVARRMVELRRDNILNEVVATYFNLLIGCSMIVVIGIGIGIKLYEKHSISDEIDYNAIKMENDKLVEQIQELSNVKKILEEIKTNVIQQRIEDSTRDETERLPYLNEHLKILDSSFNDSGTTIFERLQTFLRTLCLLLENIRQPNTRNAQKSPCDNHSFLSELANLRILLSNLIGEMDESTKMSNEQFVKNVELQMRSMSESLVSDFTKTLDKLNLKNERKVGKIVYKLNERLCLLRNTMASDSKIRLSLENNETFVENCDKILMRKFDKGKKWKNDDSTAIRGESTRIVKKKCKNQRDKDDSSDSCEDKLRVDELKVKNETKTCDKLPTDGKNGRETRKYYKSDNFVTDFELMNEDSCSPLLAPPRSTTKSTKKRSLPKSSLPTELPNNGKTKIGKKETAKKSSDKRRLKGDRPSSKYLKKKMAQEFVQSKNEAHEKNDVDVTKKISTRTNTNFVPSPLQTFNSDIEYKGKFSAVPTVQQVKKQLEKENNEVKKNEENRNIRGNENWQFERSRIRDEFRKDESIENWYFDRVFHRKSSRINHEEFEDI